LKDTSPDVELLYRRRLMALSPAQRLHMAASMFDAARTLMEAGIRRDHPDLPPAQVRRELLRRLYPVEASPVLLARSEASRPEEASPPSDT